MNGYNTQDAFSPSQPVPPSSAQAAAASPAETWRSLDEYEQSPEFLAAVDGEFPGVLDLWPDATSRRAFLQRMGASLALAGIGTAGCGHQPTEKIVPYVETPEHAVPGTPRDFATSMTVPGGAIGLLVRSRDGRPVKIEGNPLHPASRGGTDIFAQAGILDLYDPDRSQVVRHNGAISNWPAFLSALKSRTDLHGARKGAGLHLLTGSVTSPTLLRQIDNLLTAMPNARWHEFEPVSDENVRAGTMRAFGRVLSPRYHAHKADVIFALNADFLNDGPAKLRLAREFARRRRVPASGKVNMSRLYVAECTPSLTGANADHRLSLPPDRLPQVLAAIAKRLGIDLDVPRAEDAAVPEAWVAALADDLKAAGQRALVIAGAALPPEVHALAFAVNARLQSLGETVEFVAPVDRPGGRSPRSLGKLADRMRQGDVESLVILDSNPVHAVPGDVDFAALLRKVPFTAHLGLYRDETAHACRWHVPAVHFLEAWSDARGEDGTAGIVQPLIAPLYGGKTAHELLNVLLGQADQSAHDSVRAHWQERLGKDGFERRWNKALQSGVIEGTAAKPADVSLKDDLRAELPKSQNAKRPGAFHVVFRADPSVHDGRYANNGWLQELPRPFIKLTWGNAAHISPATARERGLQDGDVVQLAADGRTISIPVVLLPGQPDDVVTLHAGYGRTHAGRNGNGRGVNVAPLQTAASPWFAMADLQPAGEHVALTMTQHHYLMENRHLVRGGTIGQFQQSPERPAFMQAGEHERAKPPSLYPDGLLTSPMQWGMSIDLGACTGCNACVIACVSENNTPVVGPEQVGLGREMQWIRIDTYFSGDPAAPAVHHQPVPCMHCEHAPCEVVCPVGATTHSHEGLNEMTYNRCIGTRYCSNNCPYKVRRFNFLDFRKEVKETPVLQMVENPEVTVRSRGVMEKCTYCVQRISAARIRAHMEDRLVRDGEIVTACQAACPSEAIVFGNVADSKSAVSKQKSHPLNYGLLTELGTRPRTTYLAAVRNPNPRLEEQRGGQRNER